MERSSFLSVLGTGEEPPRLSNDCSTSDCDVQTGVVVVRHDTVTTDYAFEYLHSGYQEAVRSPLHIIVFLRP